METNLNFLYEKLSAWFKSYYVVWKHEKEIIEIKKKIVFKSYYVVWKPGNHGKPPPNNWSLNRTMQYGNLKQ